jgi:hypothetical protein
MAFCILGSTHVLWTCAGIFIVDDAGVEIDKSPMMMMMMILIQAMHGDRMSRP